MNKIEKIVESKWLGLGARGEFRHLLVGTSCITNKQTRNIPFFYVGTSSNLLKFYFGKTH